MNSSTLLNPVKTHSVTAFNRYIENRNKHITEGFFFISYDTKESRSVVSGKVNRIFFKVLFPKNFSFLCEMLAISSLFMLPSQSNVTALVGDEFFFFVTLALKPAKTSVKKQTKYSLLL